MKNNSRVRLTILSCMLSAAAAGQDLNLRTGLWETTTSMETQGNPYPEMTAAKIAEMERAMTGMTPYQRAQMAQMMDKIEEPRRTITVTSLLPPAPRKPALPKKASKSVPRTWSGRIWSGKKREGLQDYDRQVHFHDAGSSI